MSGPLSGIRVLDFTAMVAGPYCTRMMADCGAEVVKLEPPEGDYMRGREPLRDAADGTSHSAYYASLNCGKKSVVLDMKSSADARRSVLALAAMADVLVENFRPGVMKRLGLDYDSLAKNNPRLVYCSISGYGQEGAAATRPTYAPVIHAACGLEMLTMKYQDGLDRPLKSGVFIADVLAGSIAFGAVNAALVRRERTGLGEYVDVSLMEAMLGLLVYDCQEAQFPAKRRRPVYRPLAARGGFLVVAPISGPNFAAVARAIGRPELIDDARFSSTAAREQNWDELLDLLEDWTRERDVHQCEATMLAGGVPCSRYLTVKEAMASEPVRERGTFVPARDGAGEFLAPNQAFRLRNARNAVGAVVDAPGASTEAVLREWLNGGTC
jgi:crotonobetainyl-CoA:carnitine CoA-transferase CaiB-like acyl-CoA transferase